MLVTGAAFGASCAPLVEESYGTIGNKSINGIDAFVSLLEAKAGKIEKTAYMTRHLREKADVVVHFQRSESSDEIYFRRIEAMLSGMDYDTGKADDKTNVMGRRPTAVYAQNEPADDDSDEGSDSGQGKLGDSKDKGAKQYLTILYFLRDTDASAAFWARLRSDVSASPAHVDYVEAELELRRMRRERYPSGGLIPLGKRSIVRPEGLDREDLYWSSSAFPSGVRRFPLRSLMESPVFYYDHGAHSTVTLLQTGRGEVLIREIRMDRGRIIVVSNSEPFLNFSLVLPHHRTAASELIQYTLGYTNPADRTVALVQQSLAEPRRAAREESTFLRFLKVYPLNVIVLQAALLLLLYALAKWPHTGRPLPESTAGSRDFMEHFVALGGRLARAKDKEDALKRLAAFLKKGKTSGALSGSSRK
ncbi:MAG: hypothetical protein HY042_07025 [Spirochaetia bacterium]|nr:hypothetical protein [Spirochaetia bacterium]